MKENITKFTLIKDIFVPIGTAVLGAVLTFTLSPKPIYYNGEIVTTQKYEVLLNELNTYKNENLNYHEENEELKNQNKELTNEIKTLYTENSKLLGKIENSIEEIESYKNMPQISEENLRIVFNGKPIELSKNIVIIDNERYFPQECVQALLNNIPFTYKSDKVLIGEVKGKDGEPTSLLSLDPFTINESDCFSIKNSVKDYLGNTFNESLLVQDNNDSYIEYYINNEYSSFSGTIACNYLNHIGNSIDACVVGDNKELFRCTIDKKTDPIKFDISLKNIKYIKLYTWAYESDDIAIFSDLYLYK